MNKASQKEPARFGERGLDQQGAERYLSSKQVRARYADASDMWLWRRLKDDSGFPQPMHVCGRRFWRLSQLITWERARAANKETAA